MYKRQVQLLLSSHHRQRSSFTALLDHSCGAYTEQLTQSKIRVGLFLDRINEQNDNRGNSEGIQKNYNLQSHYRLVFEEMDDNMYENARLLNSLQTHHLQDVKNDPSFTVYQLSKMDDRTSADKVDQMTTAISSSLPWNVHLVNLRSEYIGNGHNHTYSDYNYFVSLKVTAKATLTLRQLLNILQIPLLIMKESPVVYETNLSGVTLVQRLTPEESAAEFSWNKEIVFQAQFDLRTFLISWKYSSTKV